MKPGAILIRGDARQLPLAGGSVQTVVTSPPYWGLRDYDLSPLVWDAPEQACEHQWNAPERAHHPGQVEQTKWKDAHAAGHGQTATSGQFCSRCSAWYGSLGLEPTFGLYVAHLVEVFRDIRRVLRDDGTVWLNIGDSYQSGNRGSYGRARIGRGLQGGLKSKNLVGIPWRVAFALQADGWWLRSDIIWSKPNPMPESVMDRPTRSHEYVFLLSKSAIYYYDAEAIKESKSASTIAIEQRAGVEFSTRRNRRSVWEIATKPFLGAHFAVFPIALVKPCILAGTSEKGACASCGVPWARVTERTARRALGWRSTCRCKVTETISCVVLDPFVGSGTTTVVAQNLGRVGIGVDLNREYLRIAQQRCAQMKPESSNS